MDEKPTLSFPDKEAFRTWLHVNHNLSAGIWIRLAKQGSGVPSIKYSEAVEVALCFGWIDGQSKREDDRFYVQKFTPRGKRSIWSKINTEKCKALIESGEMQPSGLAEIERAKADGRWDAAYDSPRTATVPAELQQALDASPKAKAAFDSLDQQNRYAILHRLQTAKKPETRTSRIAKFIEMLERGERIHP